MFDRLLLLGKGGTTLYFGDIGDDASTLINYFERNGARRCQTGDNPAEWTLEVTGNTSQSGAVNDVECQKWFEIWDASPEKQEVLRQLADQQSNLTQVTSIPESNSHDSEYAVSDFQQLKIVSRRIFQDQWRNPTYLYCKIALSICLVRGFPQYMCLTNMVIPPLITTRRL